LVGRIDRISTTHIEDCPIATTTDGQSHAGYSRCGDITKLHVTVTRHLKGQVPPEISILIAAEDVPSRACDDRPRVKELAGLHALLFLEESDGRMWTLDGPNSIHASRTPRPQHGRYIRRVKRLLDAGSGPANE
jgi:hypothetical protein